MTDPLSESTVLMLPQVRRVQVVVEYLTGQTRFYPVRGRWRIEAGTRHLVIGDRDLPHTYIPLDKVAAYHIEEIR